MHRRFAHASPKVLSILYTVTDIPEIKIPRKIPVCGTCSRTKMKKLHGKKLAEHAQEPRGYRLFAELIDNYTRKVWTMPLKSKDGIDNAPELLKICTAGKGGTE